MQEEYNKITYETSGGVNLTTMQEKWHKVSFYTNNYEEAIKTLNDNLNIKLDEIIVHTMQEKTLEEEFDEKFNLCCRADDCDADCSKQRLNVIAPFIKYREDKAREEGWTKGIKYGWTDGDKARYELGFKEGVAKYKEELLGNLPKEKGSLILEDDNYHNCAADGGYSEDCEWCGWNKCISEVKKIITS